MPKLTAKYGSWELPHVHMWKDRQTHILFDRKPFISSTTKIATIGSCFAAEIANGMERLRLNGAMHPTGLFYNTRSIRQEIERIFGKWSGYEREPYWRTSSGFVHPFKNYKTSFASEALLKKWSDELDRRAEVLFTKAEVVIITLGLIEAWINPETGNCYRMIPHPDVFEPLEPVSHRLTVSEMLGDLERIRSLLQNHTQAELIITVSPVPLHATTTSLDIRVANTESKSRIRAAVSEFVDRFPDVHYFHSYEIVKTAERLSDFMMEDGRHIHRLGVDYILQQFLKVFAHDEVAIPAVDDSWLTPPSKVAERVNPPFKKRIISHMRRLINQG